MRATRSPKATSLPSALAVPILATLLGCAPEPLTCKTNETCVRGDSQGMCEQTGYCSFADVGCSDSGRRYDVSASSELAGTCVPAAKACVEQLGLGARHSCALETDGTVSCWGTNTEGQLGAASSAGGHTPTKVGGISGVAKIGAGDSHTCALISGGEVWCWGANNQGQLGAAGGPAPIKVADLPTIKDLAAGGNHTCAVAESGDVYCWGANSDGQIGDGATDPRQAPAKIGGITGAVAVTAGNAHTCVVQQDDTILCWGRNQWGQCGLAAPVPAVLAPTPAARMGDLGADQIRAGRDHTCLLRGDKMWCWGAIGDGVISDSLRVVTGAVASHTCSLADRNGGELWCWGANDFGQLGTASTADKTATPAPARVLMVEAIASAGATHTCAITRDGTLWCWGGNAVGQLGVDTGGKSSREPLPVEICK